MSAEADVPRKRRVVAATDFSIRSDRALRRAILLAKQMSAELFVVHVVDDDQPETLVRRERATAERLLREISRTIQNVDGISCKTYLLTADAFQGILKVSADVRADLIVLGPHRRQILLDVFTGTTVERVIRNGTLPVIMANAVPTGYYANILVTVDFSAFSAEAIRTVIQLGLNKDATLTVFHAIDTPADSIIARSTTTDGSWHRYMEELKERAESELTRFLDQHGFKADHIVLRMGSAAEEIRTFAREVNVDLIVVGTHGRSGVAKLLLGSVAEDTLRAAQADVLVVPADKARHTAVTP